VLTVTNPRHKVKAGSVGKPLPGVELRIDSPNEDGIGEVLARGPNVMAGYFEDRAATEAVLQDGWLRTGDLGRLDAQGRLYLVGRKKDVIIDANGKNVYPDELEALYQDHPRIQELSIVGLPDEVGGEKVACLCVPAYGDGPREEVRREVEEHFRKVSAELPFYRRVKVLRLWDGELPKTSTRKVKRKQVVEELQRLERAASSGDRAKAAPRDEGDRWLCTLVADVLQRPATEVQPSSRFVADLGFDSLQLTELQVALDQAGLTLPQGVDLSALETVGDLLKLVGAPPAGRRAERHAEEPQISPDSRELPVPEPLSALGRSLLSFGQKVLYGGVFDLKVSGRSFIPQNRNFLVVANHASHLDMGLVKVVLGDQGERLAALAARDYFFDTPLKRAYFENFTNLIPMDRHGSLRESLKLAGDALDGGYNLLLFPEGTRSPDGQLLEFKPTLGYLALSHEVDVLPLYLEGTHEALPKGAVLPKAVPLKARIGPALEAAKLKARTRGMSRSESYRAVTRLVEEAVKALRDGRTFTLDAQAPADGRAAPREPESGGQGEAS
jgi:long-chain acyl-CoA synthetase